jgi:hypothetical protein
MDKDMIPAKSTPYGKEKFYANAHYPEALNALAAFASAFSQGREAKRLEQAELAKEQRTAANTLLNTSINKGYVMPTGQNADGGFSYGVNPNPSPVDVGDMLTLLKMQDLQNKLDKQAKYGPAYDIVSDPNMIGQLAVANKLTPNFIGQMMNSYNNALSNYSGESQEELFRSAVKYANENNGAVIQLADGRIAPVDKQTLATMKRNGEKFKILYGSGQGLQA